MSGKLFVVLSPGRPAGESDRRKLLAKGMPPREKLRKLAAEGPPGSKYSSLVIVSCCRADANNIVSLSFGTGIRNAKYFRLLRPMENFRDRSIDEFTYELPAERIAYRPLAEHDASKLLVYDNGRISETVFRNIGQYLDHGTTLVLNVTKVVRARLVFFTGTGARIEVFCLNPAGETEITTAMSGTGPAEWECLVGNAKRWKGGILCMQDSGFELSAEMVARNSDGFVVRFSWTEGVSFAEILEHFGKVPLPPYIKREADEADASDYQTVFAQVDGSVAAPTAGLHFTGPLLEKLRSGGIETANLVLHVGAGTFMPVKAGTIGEHTMHSEWSVYDLDFIRHTATPGRRLVPVGTTAMRALESLYWCGVKVLEGKTDNLRVLGQWEAYELPQETDQERALTALADYLEAKGLSSFSVATSLIIGPGYRPRLSRALITNFHQPGSTLLLLVAALIGDDWKRVYDYALQHDFRFLSYGDACLLKF